MSDSVSHAEVTKTTMTCKEDLSVLNWCHNTLLSVRELETCISLVHHRLSTTIVIPIK